ncbi:hypothetical protein, partial [Plasmodium yoelii yoelii]
MLLNPYSDEIQKPNMQQKMGT